MNRALILIVLGISLALACCAEAQQPQAKPGQDWWAKAPVYRSKYYAIKTDFSEEDTRLSAEHLDTIFESYMKLVSTLPVRLRRPARLEVYLFAKQQDYDNVLRLRFHHDGGGSWGTCISFGDTISLVGWRGRHSIEELKPLLQHEGFHQVASHFFPGLPLWANEGLAEIFERGVIVGDQLALGEFSPRDKQRLLEAAENDAIVPFEQFFAIDSSQWSQQVRAGGATTIYLEAWSIVHFLLYAEEGKYKMGFLNFLVNLNKGADWKRSFLAAFGMPDFGAIQSKWLEHVRATPASDYRETIRRLDFLAAGVAKLRQQDIYPATLAELRSQLERAKFSHDSSLFGAARQLTSRDARMYEVPLAQGVPEREFLLVDSSPTAGRRSSRQKPPPGNIVARGLNPEAFAAIWRRRGGEWEYSIVSGPDAQLVVKAAETRAARTAKRRDSAKPPGKTPQAPKTAVPETNPRKWSSADGKYSTRATLIDYADGHVQLKQADGKQIKVPYERLSRADQQYVDRWQARQ